MNLDNTLMIGSGPASINFAINIRKKNLGMLGFVLRNSDNSRKFKEDLEKNRGLIISKVNDDKIFKISGKTKVDIVYEDIQKIDDIWDTIVIATPSFSYEKVLKSMTLEKLFKIKTIILLSPSIGSTLIVSEILNTYNRNIEIITISNYFAATKFEYSENNRVTVLTRAIKKKIYVSSTILPSSKLDSVLRFFEFLGIKAEILEMAIDVEARGITLYVHPPFFLNNFSMEEIFSKSNIPKYLYKIYPEGPITQYAIRDMLELWKELSGLIILLKGTPINLLKFLNDDNYPVFEETISRYDIENFEKFNEIKQQYLLYIRYTSILVDPFSEPDNNGRYYEFSNVKYMRVYKDQNGQLVIPRIPLEDYKKLKSVYELAKKIKYRTPKIKSFIDIFENYIKEYIKKNPSEVLKKNLI